MKAEFEERARDFDNEAELYADKMKSSKESSMPTIGSTALIATGIAGKKVVEKVVNDLYDLAKNELGQQLKKWKANNHTDAIYRRVRQIRLVKTIWQIEKEVDLTSFYFPAKVVVGGKRVVVHQIADLGYDGNILIEGTVGQGKSIFLRYLASVEFCVSRRVPVFVELRRVRQGQTLVSLALQELKALGFDMTEELFHFFCGKGRLLLLLDAFDEVKEELRQDLLTELEGLLRQHEALRVVVTSRPESGVATAPLLRVFRLSPLEGREYETVIRQMAHNKDTATAIINGIRKEAAQVSQVLTTPLMVALLMVRYRIDQSLPQNDSAFYEALFMLLLQRHDKAKGGYIRPRKSGVSDTALLQFFNALSFITRKADEASFSQNQLNAFGRESLNVIGENGDVGRFLADIIDITCLILADGDECRFIHKSVQEYHAALFVRDQTDAFAQTFYTAMSARWSQWQQELRFLSVIDRYRFLKYFHIPQLKGFLGITEVTVGEYQADENRLIAICGDDQLEISKESRSFTYFGSACFWPSMLSIMNGSWCPHEMFQISVADIPSDEHGIKAEVFRVSELLKIESCKVRARTACEKLFKDLFKELVDAEQMVAQMESRKSVLQF